MNSQPKILLLIEQSRASGRQFIKGVVRYANTQTKWTILQLPPFYLTKQFSDKSKSIHLNRINPSGIIMRDTFGYKELMKANKPVIILLANEEHINNAHIVKTDSRAIAEIAINYFLNKGFRNFAFCGYNKLPWSDHRKEHFQNILEQSGYHVHTFESNINNEFLFDATEQHKIIHWLKKLPTPIVLLACNDDRAHDIVQACQICGIKIPEDIAVLGVDNDELICEMSSPSISSILLDFEVAGYQSAKIMNQCLHEKKKRIEFISIGPMHIVERSSTDITAVTCPEVSNAVHFIQDNAFRSLSVDEVASAVNVSRRVLEKRFKKYLNKTIFSVIRFERTSRIIKMLNETNLSIGEVAENLDFSNTDHIARFFKKEVGMTLQRYRKQKKLII